MTLRKITLNLLLALLSPIVLHVGALQGVFKALISGKYETNGQRFASFYEYLTSIYDYGVFFLLYFVCLIFLLLPFQLIKDYERKAGRNYTFYRKFLTLFVLFMFYIVMLGCFVLNLFVTDPWYVNLLYPGLAALFSVVFTSLTYFFIDRYEQDYTIPKKA